MRTQRVRPYVSDPGEGGARVSGRASPLCGEEAFQGMAPGMVLGFSFGVG